MISLFRLSKYKHGGKKSIYSTYKFKLSELPLSNCLHYLREIVVHKLQDCFLINEIINFIMFKIIKVKKGENEKLTQCWLMKYL